MCVCVCDCTSVMSLTQGHSNMIDFSWATALVFGYLNQNIIFWNSVNSAFKITSSFIATRVLLNNATRATSY